MKQSFYLQSSESQKQKMCYSTDYQSFFSPSNNSMIRFGQQQPSEINEPKQKVSRQQAISNILIYSEKNSNLIQQYNQDFFVNYFDRQTIQDLAAVIPANLQMKKEEFVKRLTTFIRHNDDETLFLVISLINVYKRIKDQSKSQNGIKISDFTSHICDKISTLGAELLIPLKQIPGQKIKPDPLKIRSIDLQPPVIVSEVEKQIPQISKSKQKKDKKIDPLKPLSQFFISPSTSLIMTLGSLSSTISIYTMDFQKKKEIYPECFKTIDKKLAILSFAFSQKQQRIGAIINNMGVAFWDFSDQFRSEKLIEKTNVGTKIFYLELCDEWVTANTENIIFWDLKDQEVKTKISEQKSKSVNDVCEITHIRSIAAAYTMKDESKWVIIYQPYKRKNNNSFYGRGSFSSNQSKDLSEVEFKRLARINLSPSGCHTLYYNRFTQIIIPLGYKDTIPLYNIDSQSLDISLLHELKGHQTIVTCITQIDQSDIIFTGDDRGHVIVWTLTDLRCQQLIRIANWVSSIKCIGNMLFYGDARINMIKLQGIDVKIENKGQKSLVKDQQIYGIFKHHRSQRNQLYIFTRKTCRILSMLNGKTLKIVELSAEDEQILVVQNYLNGFIIGTSKGDILHYTVDFQQKWKLNSVHQADTTELKVDKTNKFFLSNGRDSNIYIWAQKTLIEQGPRKSLLNGQDNIKEEIFITELSQKFGFFVTSSYSNDLRIWDYESCKLVHVLQISNEKSVYPVSMKICIYKPLLIVACSNEVVLLYKFSRKESIFAFRLIAKIDKKIFGLINTRCEKKNPTNNVGRGVSILQKHEFEESGLEEQKSRYSLANTLHQIALDCEQSKNTRQIRATNVDQIKVGPAFLVQQILLSFNVNDFKLILAYSKGSIIHVNLTQMIIQNFDQSQAQFKKSANVQRPIKESLIKQIYKSQVDRTPFDKKRFNYLFSLDEKNVVWNFKFHKQTVTNMDIFESQYLSTLCTDGYYKLISLYTGSVICSININFPLPIRWDYRPHKNNQFCQKIHEALLLLDEIFLDVQQLNKAEFQALNVRPFLDMICRPKTRTVKQKTLMFKQLPRQKLQNDKQNDENKEKDKKATDSPKTKALKQKQMQRRTKNGSQSFKIQILRDEFAPQDMKRSPQHYASLKSYEVYKRVKKFINVRESQVQLSIQQNKSLELDRKKTQIEERQSIIEFLSPNYLPKLLNKDIGNHLNQKLVLGERSNKKNQITLTRQDFKRAYDFNTNSSCSLASISRQSSLNQQRSKNGSLKKMNFQKLPEQIIEKKMQSTGFDFGSKKFYSNQSTFASMNRNQLQNIMTLTNSAFKMSKTNLMKELCDKTQEFKKLHKITKV